MEKLFHDIGFNFTTDDFNDIWNNAYRLDGVSNNLCIEVFRPVFRELAQKMIDHQE